MVSNFGGALESEVWFHEVITKPLVKNIRKEFDKLQQEKLKQIIEEYESVPRYKKFIRRLCFYGPGFYKTNLRYHIAKDYLDGTIEKVKKYEQERKRKEEKKGLEERIRNEMICKGMKVEFFPGNLEEYEKLKGQKYEFIDTGKQDKEMYYYPSDKVLFQFGKLGVEALIRCSEPYFDAGYNHKRRGLAVRRKTKQQPLNKMSA